MNRSKKYVRLLVAVLFIGTAAFCKADNPAGTIRDVQSDDTQHMTTPVKDSLVIQPVPHISSTPKALEVFTNLPADWVEWARREFRWERAPLYLGIGVLTTGLIAADEPTIQPFKKEYHKNGLIHTWFDISEFTGEGWFQFGIAGGFALHGLIDNNDRSLSTAVQTCEVIFACGGVVQLMKHLTGRESPVLESKPTGRWRLLPNPIAYQKRVPMYDAFPSGHVATATATLTVVMENYPEAGWIPYVGVPLIGSLAVAMMGQEIHWISDYPLAVVLGYSFGKVVADLHKSRVAREGSDSSNLIPDATITLLRGSTPGLALTWRF